MDSAVSSTEIRPAAASRSSKSPQWRAAVKRCWLVRHGGRCRWILFVFLNNCFWKSSTSPPRSEIQQQDQLHTEEFVLIFVGLWWGRLRQRGVILCLCSISKMCTRNWTSRRMWWRLHLAGRYILLFLKYQSSPLPFHDAYPSRREQGFFLLWNTSLSFFTTPMTRRR